MKLIAKKPCQYGGRKFYIGEEIPVELVAEPKKQERLGVIAIANAESGTVPGGESGTLYTQEQVQQMIAIVYANTEKASAAIAETGDSGVLTLLVNYDSRKTVKEAAKKRLDNLSSTKGEKNGAGGGNEISDGDKEGET